MEGAHLLVVDDERELTQLIRLNLQQAGFTVRTAADGREALDLLREQRPDLLLLDVMMPSLDGWGVLAELQSHEGLADLPVVMLTALSGERDVIRAHLSGAVRYLTKPFDLEGLLSTISEALQPETDEQRAQRRRQLRGFVQRLAELDAGRHAAGPRVTLSRLESPPRPTSPQERGRELLASLTDRQREIAFLLADGVEARAIADRLGTSRSNVYAARQRIAHRLGVEPEEVAATARELGRRDGP
ncbi:response regulator [Egicoccus halophilus]|uniref:response regulator n=1 Tax=Egicoccus halophilus TaxID=1670830 RepID=UPI0013EEC612|nr:response regulator [Egicoccus halophilus]